MDSARLISADNLQFAFSFMRESRQRVNRWRNPLAVVHYQDRMPRVQGWVDRDEVDWIFCRKAA